MSKYTTKHRCIAWAIVSAHCAPVLADITSSDSLTFIFNTQSVKAIPTFGDSDEFVVNTTLEQTTQGYSDSADFALDTRLVVNLPARADSANTSLDTTRMNRAWGDSDTLSINNSQPPTLNSATPQCDGITPGIMLSWIAAPNATNYDILRNNMLIFTTQTAGTTFWNVTGLSAGATYTYRIRARFGAQLSDLSNPVAATAPPCAPSPPPESQPPSGNPGPTPPVTIDRLWVWNATEGRFKPPTGPITPNPVQPTYVLAHGWDGTLNGVGVSDPPCQATAYAMSSIACAILQRVPQANIYAWEWSEKANWNRKCDFPDRVGGAFILLLQSIAEAADDFDFVGANKKAAAAGRVFGSIVSEAYEDAKIAGQNAEGEGVALSDALLAVGQANNGSLGSELHVIGHSHGGGLLGKTAQRLGSTYLINSLTALDTPNIFSIDTQRLIDPSAQLGTAFFYYSFLAGGLGRAPLPNGGSTNILLDGLHVQSCGGVPIGHSWIHGCDAACNPSTSSGWYPGAILGNASFDDENHSILDVTSLPHGYFDESAYTIYEFNSSAIGACCFQQGCAITTEFYCILHSGNFMGEGSNCNSCLATRTITEVQEDPNLAGMSLLLDDPLDDAASWQGENVELVIGADPDDPANHAIVLTEQGDASFFKNIAWPTMTVQLTFDYMFRDPRGTESLTVYLDDQVIYYDNSQTTPTVGQLGSSGTIYIGQAAGTTAQLTFVLRTDGTPGGSVVLDNIRVWGFIPGDMSGDGKLDGLDIQAFTAAVQASSTDAADVYIADFTGDSVIDESDIPNFVDALMGQ